MFKFLKSLFCKKREIHFIANGSEILPEKLSSEEESKLVEEFKAGSMEASMQTGCWRG